MKVWLNGALVEADEKCISPLDRGLLLGDGVFETLRSYDRHLPMLREHLGRLEAGAQVLRIPLPAQKYIASATRELLSASGPEDFRVRITVTSGTGPPGLARAESSPTLLITAWPLKVWPPTASAIVARWAHDEHNPLAGVKTTSRADTVLALEQARSAGADEAIFLNMAANVCEATTANVFAIRRRRVETPPLSAGCLPGITRAFVLRLCAELDLEASESDLPLNALKSADEIFLTSSTRGVQPLVAVDGRPIGDGDYGPITLALANAYEERIQELR